MSKFRKSGSSDASQSIPTSALPDIIFILLFFFIVTTKPKETNKLVNTTLPDVSQIQLLDRKAEKAYIYIGKPKNAELYGTGDKIQVEGKLITPASIKQFVATRVAEMPENVKKASNLEVILEVDKEAKYGIESDVKIQLREADARKVNYISKQNKKKK